MRLKILTYPNQILRSKCKEVTSINKKIKTLCSDMIETMEHANGVGLAAPQIGKALRILIAKNLDTGDNTIMINPVIRSHGEAVLYRDEGCLSLPYKAQYLNIPRYHEIEVEYYSIENKKVCESLEGMNARIVQHEIDHLNGRLLIDYEMESLFRK